jgi:hypothetical protein
MSPEDLRKEEEEEQEEVDEWDPVMKRDAGGRDAEGSTELLSPAAASSEETAADGDGSKSGATKKAGAPSTYGIIQDVVLLGLPANASVSFISHHHQLNLNPTNLSTVFLAVAEGLAASPQCCERAPD